jgi:protein-S-isoprenylcysteine O-methyltransferase Ste14
MPHVRAWAASPPTRRIASISLDLIERVIIVALFYGLAGRLIANYAATHNFANLPALGSEAMVVVLALVRRSPQTITFRVDDWTLALGASCASLLLRPANVTALGPHEIGWTLQAVGFAGALWCKAALFRNFGIAPAVRGVAVRGPYAFLRHPMYASYFISLTGFLYAFPTLWNAAVLVVWSIGQVLRIIAEERILTTDARYQAYSIGVRWRVIPGLF